DEPVPPVASATQRKCPISPFSRPLAIAPTPEANVAASLLFCPRHRPARPLFQLLLPDRPGSTCQVSLADAAAEGRGGGETRRRGDAAAGRRGGGETRRRSDAAAERRGGGETRR